MSWTCSACTLLNAESATRCDACDKSRPKKAKPSSSVENGMTATATTARQTTLFGTLSLAVTKSSRNISKKIKDSSRLLATDNAKLDRKKAPLVSSSKNDNDHDSNKNNSSSSSIINFSSRFKPQLQPQLQLRVQPVTTSTTALTYVSRYTALKNVSFSTLWNRAQEIQKAVFGINELRFLQPQAIQCALQQQSQVIIMATGGGKSLCYQLPATVLGGTTIVVSPLKALMADQVSALVQKKIHAALLNSTLTESNKILIFERLLQRPLTDTNNKKQKQQQQQKQQQRPQPPITLLYVTPEQIKTQRFQSALHELDRQKCLTAFAIDEAHCISSWGHDFRPAYRQLGWLRQQFSHVPLMACTATATPNVIQDIIEQLQLQNCPCHVGSFDRTNLSYQVRYKDVLESEQGGGAALRDLIQFLKQQHSSCQLEQQICNGIIYCHKKNDTMDLAQQITKETGVRAVAYHGGMKEVERSESQQAWMSGKAPIAVATIAFGMGIDLAHVRYVIHWNHPKSIEAFYQESGRAGRDGLPCTSIVYYSKHDTSLFQFLASKRNHGKEQALESLERMLEYFTAAGCRRKYLLKFFGETKLDPKTVCRTNCDYCQNPEVVTRMIEAATACTEFSFHTKAAGGDVAWDGQWNGPHGDDDDDDDDPWGDNHGDSGRLVSDEGLLITGNGGSSFFEDGGISNHSMARRKPESAKSVLDKYEAIEFKKGHANGFVNFRQRVAESERAQPGEYPKSSRPDRGVIIPEHLRKNAPDPWQHFENNKSKQDAKTSKELGSERASLEQQLAEMKAKQQALLAKKKLATAMAPPPPPPPPPPVMGQGSKKRRRA